MPEPGYVFELPSLGADMDSGSVLEWYVQVGDQVDKGDVVALVATEKADIDVEIWHPGRVAEILVQPGTEVPVGTPLLQLDRAGGRAEVTPPPPSPAPTRPLVTAVRPIAATAPGSGRRPLSSPLARTLAAERGVELATVRGSGPHGAIVARDVPSAAVAPAASPPATRAGGTGPAGGHPAGPGDAPAPNRALSSMRRAIATRMEKANREIPHYHLELDVDLGPALDRLEQHNRGLRLTERVLPAALFLQATARAAAMVPELNGHWADGAFAPVPHVDLGVAISLRPGGLVTPVIVAADTLSVDEIMATLRDMVARARSGSLRSRWMVEASLTVTNLGDNGADRVIGVIFPPQVALVGFGRTRDRPWVVDGLVVARPVVSVSLAADHRASDGATGSRFLAAVAKGLVQGPNGTAPGPTSSGPPGALEPPLVSATPTEEQ